MKNHLILSLLFFIIFINGLTAQVTSTENYSLTRNYQVARTTPVSSQGSTDVVEQVVYYDGLGRPKQQVAIRASGDQRDILTHIDYDIFGRQIKEWLPYENTNTSYGSYRSSDQESATNTFYRNKYPLDISSVVADRNAFSEKLFEASPLSSLKKQAAPGSDWRMGGGHEIEMNYDTNEHNDNVTRFNVTYTNQDRQLPQLKSGGPYYLYHYAGELYKTVTKDENHDGSSTKYHTVEEYKDKMGRVILKRTYGDSDTNGDGDISDPGEGLARHETYYVYDEYGNLTFVLPPKAEAGNYTPTQTVLDELCYQYKYDSKNRLIEKKIPGKDWESIVYTTLDQPAMTQDANLKAQNKWLFTKYDAFGRVVYTGRWSGNTTRDYLQGVFDGASVQYESRTTSANTYAGQQVYYSNNAKPNGINDVYIINYYDSYLPSGAQGKVIVPLQTSYGTSITTNVKTLPTVNRVRVLTTNDWITTTTGYDDKGRAIWIRTVNDYLNTDETVEMMLDFTGKILKTKTIHNKQNPNLTVITEDFFTYDHMGRMEKHTQKIDNGSTEELIALNEYDELGQLKNKKVGNTMSQPLQVVDYTYNVRGWLKGINNLGNIGSDLFAFEMFYNNPTHGTSTGLFNGNISQVKWKSKGSNTSDFWYIYEYDALNRIKKGQFDGGGWWGRYNLENVVYDKNGNITKLVRKGHVVPNPSGSNFSDFGTIDNLTYSYDAGNKLLKVTDAINISNAVKGQFNDGNKNSNDYEYDVNGNMVKDLNKGIIGVNNTAGIQYNHLNLPTSVNVMINKGGGTGVISYVYDAKGIKLEKSSPEGTTQYSGNYIYKNGVLEFFSHPEGYVEKPGTQYKYVFQYKDHLGNVRLSYQDKNNNNQIDITSDPNTSEIISERNYYPFGLEHKGYNNNFASNITNKAQEFTFNGIEYEKEIDIDLFEMDVRSYDPAIARFTAIDPITHHSASTYTAFDNNPIYWTDPSGANAEEDPTKKTYSKTIITSSIDADGNTSVKMRTYSSTTVTAEDGSKTVTQSVTTTINTISNVEGEEGIKLATSSTEKSQVNSYNSDGNLVNEGEEKIQTKAVNYNEDFGVMLSWTKHIANYNKNNGSTTTWNENVLERGVPITKAALSFGPALMLKSVSADAMPGGQKGKGGFGMGIYEMLEFSSSKINSINKQLILSNQDKIDGIIINRHRIPKKVEEGPSVIESIYRRLGNIFRF